MLFYTKPHCLNEEWTERVCENTNEHGYFALMDTSVWTLGIFNSGLKQKSSPSLCITLYIAISNEESVRWFLLCSCSGPIEFKYSNMTCQQ